MMNLFIRALGSVLVGLVLLAPLTVVPHASAQSVTSEETVRSVRRMLERLPYYGVFDYIVFRVDRGTVHLGGYSFEGRLKADAEMAAKRAMRAWAGSWTIKAPSVYPGRSRGARSPEPGA